MKIEKISAHYLRLPAVTTAADGTQDTCLIRLETDAGITGWGEIDSGPTVAKAIVEAPLSHKIANGLDNILRGADPLAVEACVKKMVEETSYYGLSAAGRHAMAGVEIALWDVAGKAHDCPIYELFGGPHKTRFRAYCSLLFGDTPAQTYERARKFADRGFTAIKFGWGPMGEDERTDIELVREFRRGAGERLDILIDAGQVWDWKTALRRAHQFSEYDPFWLEEPINPEDLEGYANLSAASPVPIAAGEANARYEEV